MKVSTRRSRWQRALLLAVILLASIAGTVAVAPREAAAAPELGANATLATGQRLGSPNGAYWLTPQSDGNLVLYSPRGAVWSTGTWASAGGPVSLTMQGDGNLVLVGPRGAVWSTGTWGTAGDARLSVTDSGDLVVASNTVPVIWTLSQGPRFDRMFAGSELRPGQSLVSFDRANRLVYQTDGNLVVYRAGTPVWATGTWTRGADRLLYQSDGNLVMYGSTGAVWSTGTWKYPGGVLSMQNDGAVVMYQAVRPVWSSKGLTNRRAYAFELDAAAQQSLISGGAWRAGCPVPLSAIVGLRFPYVDRSYVRRWGTLYVNRDAVEAVTAATEAMEWTAFPIWEFGGYYCRQIVSGGSWSQHAYGRAVDFNPTVNPYSNGSLIVGNAAYLDRSRHEPGMFYPDSAGVQAFAAYGWGWGGTWTSLKDYMHFSATNT